MGSIVRTDVRDDSTLGPRGLFVEEMGAEECAAWGLVSPAYPLSGTPTGPRGATTGDDEDGGFAVDSFSLSVPWGEELYGGPHALSSRDASSPSGDL